MCVCGHADDDSWLNLPLLQTYLAQYDETLPFGIGWIWDASSTRPSTSSRAALACSSRRFVYMSLDRPLYTDIAAINVFDHSDIYYCL